MPRPLKTDRPIKKGIHLPESLVAQVDLLLWSELEGRVPFGAWQDYIKLLIEKDLQQRAGLR